MAEYLINHADPTTADFILLAAPYDGTSSFGKGADQGPSALKKCFNEQLELYERWTDSSPAKIAKIAFDDSLDLKNLPPEDMAEKVRQKFLQYHTAGKYVIIVGGEHSVSIGIFKALAECEKRVTVVQIDAHPDLRDDDSDYNDVNPSPYAHSCVMRRALDLGLKTVQVGLRTYSQAEKNYILRNRLKVFEWNGSASPMEEILRAIETDKMYLTLDIDGIDPAFMPATGTPVSGGLDWYYTIKLIIGLYKTKKVIASDIVELCPRPLDHLTEFNAAQLCYLMMACRLKYGFLK